MTSALRSLFSSLRVPQRLPDSIEVLVSDRPVRVAVRRSARAKSYRLAVLATGPVLTLPQNGSWKGAEAFLGRHRQWLAERLERAPQGTRFVAGATVTLRGVPHRIAGTGALRGQVVHDADGAVLHVPGLVEHQPRRLETFLRAQALADLTAATQHHAQRLGVTVAAITLRAQKSRWGSCSSSGTLSFNWRLILAPPFVLDYVAAHEVAHLVEMNHSPAFWATVKRTLPDMDAGRAWLKAHGQSLMVQGLG